MAAKKAPAISIKKADYPNIPAASFKELLSYYKRTLVTERKIKNALAKRDAEWAGKKNQPNVQRLVISIEWSNSRTWGACPTASYEVYYANGKMSRKQNAAHASGCGYDKESTVVAQVFNMTCLGMATKRLKSAAGKKSKPYGVYSTTSGVFFDGGIGMSCYRTIAEWLGGKMEHTSSSRNFDVYTFTFKKRK